MSAAMTDTDAPCMLVEGETANRMGTAPKKVVGRPFQKGQPSANPSGRPRVDPEIALLFQAALPGAVKDLVDLTKHVDKRIALKAILEVISRNLGQSTVNLNVTGSLDTGSAALSEVVAELPNALRALGMTAEAEALEAMLPAPPLQ